MLQPTQDDVVQTAPQFEGGSVCGGLDPTGLLSEVGLGSGRKRLGLRLVVGNKVCVWVLTGALGEARGGSLVQCLVRGLRVLSPHGSPCVEFLAWSTCPQTVFSLIPTSRKTVFMTVRRP